MTFPRLAALNVAWQQVPPLAHTLHRLAVWAGAAPAPKAVAASLNAAMDEARAAGLPVGRGRPDDPMLALCGL